MCRSWIFLEFGKKWWLVFAHVRGLQWPRPSTFRIWWLLIQADSSQGQNLVLLPTNAQFWKCANKVHWFRSEVCCLKLPREVFKFWRKNLEFVEPLNSKGNRPSKSVYLACLRRVHRQQVNWANSRHSGKYGIKKKNFKNKFQNLLCPVDWIYLSKVEALISLDHVSLSGGGLCASLYCTVSTNWSGRTIQVKDRMFLI